MPIAKVGQKCTFVDNEGKRRPAQIIAVHPPERQRVTLEDDSKMLPGDTLPSRHPRSLRMTLEKGEEPREGDRDVMREQVPAGYFDDPDDDQPPVLISEAYERVTVTREVEVLVVTREVRGETVDLLYSMSGAVKPATARRKTNALHESQQVPDPSLPEPQLRNYWVEA